MEILVNKYMRKIHDIILFAMHGETDKLASLLENDAYPDECDDNLRTALHWAAQEGHMDIIDHLIHHGAALDLVDSDGFTPLSIAVGENSPLLVNRLLNAGASTNIVNPHDRNTTALHLACAWNYLEVAKILVATPGVDINAKDADGKTCLDYAIEADAKKLVDYLRDYGAQTGKS